MRKINKAGIDLIKSFEGFSSKPYPDPGTGAEPYTIGYGSTYYEDGTLVTMQDPYISEERAVELLNFEVNEKAQGVENLVTIPLNENEFAALTSFAYNCGTNNLKNSTLLKLLNSGASKTAVGDQFLRWNRAAGRVLPGLTRRRQAERALFLQPVVELNQIMTSSIDEEQMTKDICEID